MIPSEQWQKRTCSYEKTNNRSVARPGGTGLISGSPLHVGSESALRREVCREANPLRKHVRIKTQRNEL